MLRASLNSLNLRTLAHKAAFTTVSLSLANRQLGKMIKIYMNSIYTIIKIRIIRRKQERKIN